MKILTGSERDVDYSRNATLDVGGNALSSGDSSRDAAQRDERARAAQKLRLAIARAEERRGGDSSRLEASRKERLLAMIAPATAWTERETGQTRRRDEEHGSRDENKADGEGSEANLENAREPSADTFLPFASLFGALSGRDAHAPTGQSAGGRDERSADQDAEQLIAASLRTSTQAAASAPSAEAPGSAAGAVQAKIDKVVDRVEVAWRNHFALRPNEAIHLQLRLETEAPGAVFNELSVAVSSSAVDVTLMGIGAAPTPALIEAAQALAQRLHQRFPNRVVRVIGAEEEAEAPSAGLSVFSQILRGSGEGA